MGQTAEQSGWGTFGLRDAEMEVMCLGAGVSRRADDNRGGERSALPRSFICGRRR